MITFTTTLYFERRKEQRAERQEAQEHARLRRQALRLVWSELDEMDAAIEVALDKNHWWTDPPHNLPQQHWQSCRATLAELLDDQAWSRLAKAHGMVGAFNRLLTMGRDGKEAIHHGNQYIELIECCDITEFWQRQLLSVQDPIKRAVDVLNPIVQPEVR
jgi:hypothetical protein